MSAKPSHSAAKPSPDTSSPGRRRLLAAGLGLLVPGAGMAQTLLEGSASSGAGWTPPGYEPPWSATSMPQPSETPRQAPQQAPAPVSDWRQHLLLGERSVVLRRDGPAKRIRYCTADGLLDPAGYAVACHLLRDVQANKMFPMDPRLLDVLCGIQRWMEYHGRGATIEVTSGFRTIKTNGALEGAAMNSMHLYGRAADIVISGAGSALVGAMVRQFNADGGTGIYLARGFVHVDTGAARTWVSRAPRRRS